MKNFMNSFNKFLNLNDLPKSDIASLNDNRKLFNDLYKKYRAGAKLENCYYCGKRCNSFCNSHSLPAFLLRNIAQDGKVLYSNSLLEYPILNKDKGIKESGTFRLICNECDSRIFQDYENASSYDSMPTIKMLAQIAMKNNLKNISKRLQEIEIYTNDPCLNRVFLEDSLEQRNIANELDLKEYENLFKYAKKVDAKPFDSDYHLVFHEKLHYVVPIAFQGTIALPFDLEGNMINNIYNLSSKYKIFNINICIFPLEVSSEIIIFVEKKNTRYRSFFRQFKELSLDNQLSLINYIIFRFSEEYFLSPSLDTQVLQSLKSLAGETTEVVSCTSPSLMTLREAFSYSEHSKVPNLLSFSFSI